MFVVWVLPYGLAGAYDFLLGQGFFPSTYPTLSHVIPSWLPSIWLIIGVIAIIIVTFEGAYRITQKADKPSSIIDAVGQGFKSVVSKLDELIVSQGAQQNIVINTREAIVITGATTGEPKLIAASEGFGTVHTGSRQTFSGLSVSDSPIFVKVPIGYVGITTVPIINNIIEVKVIAYIETKLLHQAATVTLGISGSQEGISLIIPVNFAGFCTQTKYVTIDMPHEDKVGDIGISIAIEITL